MAPTGGGNPGTGAGRGRGQNQSQSSGQGQTSLTSLGGSQVAASNSTLNAWVRRRQPSWLANATPVQPSPRQIPSRQSPTPASPTLLIATASSLPHPEVEPQDPPQFSPFRQQLQPQSRSRPTPTPTPPAPPPPPPPALPLAPSPSLSHIQAQAPADPVCRSPAPTDEASPQVSIRDDISTARDPCIVVSRESIPTTTAHFVPNGDVNENHLPSPPSRAVNTPALEGAVASLADSDQMQPVASATSHDPVMALNPNSAPVATVFSDASATSRVSPQWSAQPLPQSIPSKRRFLRRFAANHSLDFLDSLGALGKMDLYLQQVGGVARLEESIERPRFALLQKACREGDFFFVVLHQLFCVWTANQASVHWLCGEENRDISLVNNAFAIIGTVLRDNSMLGERLLQWFANFPLPNLAILQHNVFCRHTTRQVLDFLTCISQHWAIVNHRHSMLGYPLLVSELLTSFHLFSPSLQTIVFRASRRTLGVPDYPFGDKFDEVFKVDQDKHRNPDDGSFSVQFEPKAYEEYNKTLVRKYKSLMGLFQSTPSNTSNMPSSHHSPSASPLSSTLLSPGFILPAAPNNPVQVERSQGFTPPLLSPMGTARAGPPTKISICPPSTDSPIDLRQTPASTFSVAAFAPQFSPPLSHALLRANPATGGVVTSPYHSPTPIQQSYFGALNMQTQQNPQRRPSYDQLRQQQQQHLLQHYQAQQQQIQQHQIPSPVSLLSQYGGRTSAQPRATTNPRVMPLQTAPSLSPQIRPAAQYPPGAQSGSGRPAPASPVVSETANGTRQANLGSSSLSPQIANSVRPSYVRPRAVVPLLPQRKAASTIDRLIPAPGVRISRQEYPHTPYEKRSVELSLHQAHLRSPKRLLREYPTTVPVERHYQAVKDFALYPTPIPPQAYLYSFTFNIADAVFAKLSFDEQILGELGLINRFQNGSLRLRVKCCNQPTATETISDSVWVTAETAWPDHIFMTMNDQVVTVKRKQHHSKDIPVDVTSFVRLGTNTLSVSIPTQPLQHRQHTPCLAVEIVEALSHSIILQMVRGSGSRPASQTREIIQNRLAAGVPGAAGDDHELEMPNDGISIDLADPFTATIFNVPVRGIRCSHLECFDLENWLNTRLGKNITCVCGRGGGSYCVCPKEPSFVDKWKCPFCDSDARPYSLLIDEFLAEVRTQLERNDQLRTKSITVYADGSWKPSLTADDDDSDANSDGDGTPTTHIASSKAVPAREVIELDDD